QLNGGNLVLDIAFNQTPQSTDRDIKLTGVGSLDVFGTATFSGVISDPTVKGSLNLDGSGIVALTNTGNSYQGGTRINSGYLFITNGDTLGNAAGSVLLNGGSLVLDGNISLASGRTLVSGGATNINIAVTGTNTGSIGVGNNAGAIVAPGAAIVKS